MSGSDAERLKSLERTSGKEDDADAVSAHCQAKESTCASACADASYHAHHFRQHPQDLSQLERNGILEADVVMKYLD